MIELKKSVGYKALKKHREDEALSALKEALPHDVVSGDASGVFVLKRTDGVTEIRFLVNTEDKEKSFAIRGEGFSSAEIWNAETGKHTPPISP